MARPIHSTTIYSIWHEKIHYKMYLFGFAGVSGKTGRKQVRT